MSADRAILDRVAHIIATYHDPVWARLPLLGPMSAGFERERPLRAGGRLGQLVTALHDLLFAHLDREDRILLALASRSISTALDRSAARLHVEHFELTGLLDQIRLELGDDLQPPAAAGTNERALRAELRDLDQRIREQIQLEETVLRSCG